MLLSLATGTFYFTWVVTGLSLSVSLIFLIIGIPVFLLFVASVRVISLIEGRIVETLLGVRMPRRPRYEPTDQTWLERIKNAITDGRTWLTMVYMALMLPVGVVYFTAAVTALSVSFGLIAIPFVTLFVDDAYIYVNGDLYFPYLGYDTVVFWPLSDFLGSLLSLAQQYLLGIVVCVLMGVLLGIITLHLAKLVTRLHGKIAEIFLVRM